MAATFVHLLITRFNAAVDYGYGAALKRLQDDWLRQRISLFEQYCLPSVLGQVGAQFHWLVFFDGASPEWLRKRVRGFEPSLIPVYIDEMLTDDVIRAKIAELGLVSSPYLISTRLDSDDALSTHHLATVQGTFHMQPREFIEFPVGLQSFRGHLYSVYYPSNPFLSLIERVENSNTFTTVHCIEHNQVRKAGKVRTLIRSPQWLQVLHSSNVGNSLRGIPRIKSHTHSDFSVTWPCGTPDDSFSDRVMFTGRAYAKEALRRLLISQGRSGRG